MTFLVTVWVRPGARRTGVGGRRGELLRVDVTAPADRGRANDAVCRAIADAFGVPPRDVTLARGARGREKTLLIDPPPADAAARLAALLGTAH